MPQRNGEKRPPSHHSRKPWYRKRPQTFGLVAIGALATVAASSAAVGSFGLNQKGLSFLMLAHGIGVLFAARLVYTGASRWADPKLGVVTTTYQQGRTAGGEAVSMATGSKERRYTPRGAVLMAGVGLAVWLLIGGAATAVTQGWIFGSTNFVSAPHPSAAPQAAPSAGRTRSE